MDVRTRADTASAKGRARSAPRARRTGAAQSFVDGLTARTGCGPWALFAVRISDFVNTCKCCRRETPPHRARPTTLDRVFERPPNPDRHSPEPPTHATWALRRIRPAVIAATGVGAGALLWALAGWPGLPLAIALAAALLVRLVGVLFLPRRLRERSILLALVVALAVLVGQSPWWSTVLAAGLAAAVMALTQRGRVRVVTLAVGGLVAVVGLAGLVVDQLGAAARRDAEYARLGDIARGQMLPHSPEKVPEALMRVTVDAVTAPAATSCTLLFTDRGLRAFLHAMRSPDCLTGLRTLGATITDPENFDRIERSTLVLHPRPDGTIEIDTCQLRWHNTSDALSRLLTGSAPPTPPAGPPPGRLVVAPAYTVAWQITDYQPCPPR